MVMSFECFTKFCNSRFPANMFKLVSQSLAPTLGFPYDIAYLVFFKSSQMFAKHGFASVLRNLKIWKIYFQKFS